MAIYKRKNGVYFVQFMHNGKNYIKNSTTNRNDAVILEQKMKAQVITKPNEISVNSAIQLWIDKNISTTRYNTLVSIGKWYKQHTINLMLHNVDTAWINRTIDLKRKEQVSNGTINNYIQFINSVIKNAETYGYTVNKYQLPKTTQTKGRLRVISQTEEQVLINALYGEAKDLFVLLIDTGARFNEIRKIEWNQIDLDNRTITVWRSKVSNESVLFMTDRVFEVLNRLYMNKTTSFVFNSQVTSLRKVIKSLYGDVRIHDIRHTCASKLVQNGLSIQETQVILGHSNIQTTMRYAHLEQSAVTQKARDILNSFS
jgi:integrase